MSILEKPVFFSIRKNSSYFMWKPYGEFFSFKSVCIRIVGEEEFMIYEGECEKVQVLGQKCLVQASKYRRVRNGIYLLAEERGGKYIFRLVKPLREKA
jgi:hypothetical protein